MKLSVTIITFNERANIERAITSAQFADEIVVVDSGSKDGTREMARALGARVYEHPFQGFGQQKNYADSLCQGEWILNIDADEEVSKELEQSILSTIHSKTEYSIYKMPRLTFFCGGPIYHGGWYPDLKARLYKKGMAKWSEPHVHEDLYLLNEHESFESSERKVSGQFKEHAGELKGILFHYSFPTVKSQIMTNIKYAELGSKDFINRKKRRPYYFELLLRPFAKFFECYLLKFGFLDGKRGLIIAINASHSMFMKYSFAYMDEKND